MKSAPISITMYNSGQAHNITQQNGLQGEDLQQIVKMLTDSLNAQRESYERIIIHLINQLQAYEQAKR